MHNCYTHPCLIINICKASTQNYNSTVQVQQDAIIKFMIDYLINHRNRMRTNLFNEIINSKVSCEIVASRSIVRIRTMNLFANYAFLLRARHRTVRFSTRDIDFRIDGNVVISMCGRRYSRCPVCEALFAINRSLYRWISDLAGSSSGRSCSDRIRSAIAHNTNRMFRGRTRGDRLRTHHVGSVRSARSRTGIPVLRRCKRYFPRVRTVSGAIENWTVRSQP